MKFIVLALCVVAASASLSADQYSLVSSAWDQVRHSEVDILYNVFKAYPDIQARFPKFAGKDLDSLKSTAAFATHAGRIVGFVSEVIALSGDASNTSAFNTLVADLAKNHKARGIQKSQFDEFRTALTSYMAAHASWNDATAAAWNAAADNIYNAIYAAL